MSVPTKEMPQTHEQGFTLIELSIVLVIIGLIVGGVLVGQDMIKAAELRAAVGQLEKYDTSVNAFRGKYNGLPGDLPNATTFGMSTTGFTAGKTGNGVLDPNTDSVLRFCEEPAAFFDHMAFANLIQEPITGVGGTAVAHDFTLANVDTIGNYAPASKLGKGVRVLAQSASGLNYYALGVAAVADGVLTWTAASIPPIEAYSIDSKLDDGMPNTGKVQTFQAAGGIGTADDNTNCTTATGAAGVYLTNTVAAGSAANCLVKVRASW